MKFNELLYLFSHECRADLFEQIISERTGWQTISTLINYANRASLKDRWVIDDPL